MIEFLCFLFIMATFISPAFLTGAWYRRVLLAYLPMFAIAAFVAAGMDAILPIAGAGAFVAIQRQMNRFSWVSNPKPQKITHVGGFLFGDGAWYDERANQ